MTRKPCLAEDWFVEDGLVALAGLCPMCAAVLREALRRFADEDGPALRQVYRMSRACRVKRAEATKQHPGPHDDWECLRLMLTIEALLEIAFAVCLTMLPAGVGALGR